jgi:hypothetical protein
MRFLKIFEEFSEMYEPISVSEFSSKDKQKIPFGPNELNQVVDLIEDKGYKLTYREDSETHTAWDDKDVVLLRFEKIMDNSRKSFYGTPIPATKRCRVIVYKIEDDYFPICLRELEMNHRLIDESFYKCDQFEGLVNFINEKLSK